MKHILKKSLLTTALVCGVSYYAATAHAQTTVSVPVTVTVDNSITVAVGTPMNFGTIVAQPGPSGGTDDKIDIVLDTTGDVTATGDNDGVGAVVDESAATAAVVNISDAVGGTINITIGTIVDPVNGVESFTLEDFTTSYNGGAETGRTIGSAFAATFAPAFGGGTNTLTIGATLVGDDGDTFTASTPYVGSFDVTVAY